MSNPQFAQLLADAEAGKAGAQFVLSQVCQQQQDMESMLRWLRKACDQRFPDALGAMGYCFEKGQGVDTDVTAAMDYYDQAVAGESMVAAAHQAQLLYKSINGREDVERIYQLLTAAAAANVVPALRAIGYLAMQHESRQALGVQCLRRAASLGDPVSAFFLGWFSLNGRAAEVSHGEAAHYLQQAASGRYPFAAELLSSVRGTQVAPEPDVSSIDFGPLFELYPGSASVEKTVFCTEPPITLFKGVLNTIDCSYLIFLARPHLRRAHVIDPDGEQAGLVSQVRTSMSTYLPFEIVDIISRYIELKIIRETGEDLAASEPMSILRYAPGEYYRPHVDYFNPKLKVSEALLKDGGQRTASAVTYLTAPTAGGGTSFPKLDITVPPLAGGTLWFRNCLTNGEVDERSLHAGDTVDDGEKWVVTKWFREQPTRYLQL